MNISVNHNTGEHVFSPPTGNGSSGSANGDAQTGAGVTDAQGLGIMTRAQLIAFIAGKEGILPPSVLAQARLIIADTTEELVSVPGLSAAPILDSLGIPQPPPTAVGSAAPAPRRLNETARREEAISELCDHAMNLARAQGRFPIDIFYAGVRASERAAFMTTEAIVELDNHIGARVLEHGGQSRMPTTSVALAPPPSFGVSVTDGTPTMGNGPDAMNVVGGNAAHIATSAPPTSLIANGALNGVGASRSILGNAPNLVVPDQGPDTSLGTAV